MAKHSQLDKVIAQLERERAIFLESERAAFNRAIAKLRAQQTAQATKPRKQKDA